VYFVYCILTTGTPVVQGNVPLYFNLETLLDMYVHMYLYTCTQYLYTQITCVHMSFMSMSMCVPGNVDLELDSQECQKLSVWVHHTFQKFMGILDVRATLQSLHRGHAFLFLPSPSSFFFCFSFSSFLCPFHPQQ
jgi:hypothetical protein